MRGVADRLRRGFTLLELMLAVTILSAVTLVTYLSFATTVDAWRRGVRLTETLHRGDYVIEQLATALRSAYYPETARGAEAYGFWHEDNGDGPWSADVISWVKVGPALIGGETAYAGSPHRVKMTIEANDEREESVAVRSWRVKGQPEEFDPEELPPLFLSTRIRGMNCRAAFEREAGEIDWLDEWEETNKLPRMVEITLYVESAEERGEPVEVKRLVRVPTAELCWR